MYRLAKIEATNLIGFMAGLGKKTFELDLTDQLDHNMFVLCGSNAKGKSVLLSIIHPLPWPSDGRNRFIIQGKNGTLIRTYVGDDGTTIVTKCYYKPKKDGGHTVSCFFELTRNDEDPAELNPNGNVTSYNALLYTYFGINKDFVTFASFSSAITSIVRMTDQERKDSVSTMTPNVKRFEVAYDILNEKYKNLRNLIRNVSQKILTLRDEASLEADFERLNSEVKRYTDEREAQIKKLAKAEGGIRELIGDMNVDDMVSEYHRMSSSLAMYDVAIDASTKKLHRLYGKVGVEPESKDSINFPGIDNVASMVLRCERKLAAVTGSHQSFQQRMERIEKELHRTENDIAETESMLYGIQEQNLDELVATRDEYRRRLKELRYTKVAKDYEDMNYDEAVALSRSLVMVEQMIQSLYDEYGELVS